MSREANLKLLYLIQRILRLCWDLRREYQSQFPKSSQILRIQFDLQFLIRWKQRNVGCI